MLRHYNRPLSTLAFLMAMAISVCAEPATSIEAPSEKLSSPHASTLPPPQQINAALPANLPAQLGDRIWLINTRSMTQCTCCADLDAPAFTVARMTCNGATTRSSLGEYLAEIRSDRPLVIYVHGYRFDYCEAVERGLYVYRQTEARRCSGPVDWVIWSWPSERTEFITRDVREKAKYADTQGLYLAWLLREQVRRSVKTKLIGYSLGGRVVTGSLHALAGGSLGHRTLPGESVRSAKVDVGLIAPAVERDWLSPGEYHGLATSNIEDLLLMYNQRDIVLKRYWFIDKVRGAVALGLGRMQSFAPRVDGTQINLRARDCSRSIGIAHDELDYYKQSCGAGREMAKLISDPSVGQR
ncbi:alpha/beta hydrolase [Novipirellula artificiosorum]|nr:alpha/beta hydrolase [Novipirellula artificiosorum]